MEYRDGEWPISQWQSSINLATEELRRAERLADELSRAISVAGRDIDNLLSERFDDSDVPGEDVCAMASRIERDVLNVIQRVNADVSKAIDNVRDFGPKAQGQIANYY